MAARDGAISYDQLHHFVASGAAPLEAALLVEADKQVGGDDAWLIIDDTALPKKGRNSVGVAPQHAAALGKNANCQTLLSLTLASREVPVIGPRNSQRVQAIARHPRRFDRPLNQRSVPRLHSVPEPATRALCVGLMHPRAGRSRSGLAHATPGGT